MPAHPREFLIFWAGIGHYWAPTMQIWAGVGSCVKDSDSSDPEAAAPEAHIQATIAEVVKMLNGARARHRFDEFVSFQCLRNVGAHSGARQNRDPEGSYSGVPLRTLFQTLGFLMAGFLLAKMTVAMMANLRN